MRLSFKIVKTSSICVAYTPPVFFHCLSLSLPIHEMSKIVVMYRQGKLQSTTHYSQENALKLFSSIHGKIIRN